MALLNCLLHISNYSRFFSLSKVVIKKKSGLLLLARAVILLVMRLLLILFTVAITALPLSAQADIVFPHNNTVYLEYKGEPYTKPADFQVQCYGYSYPPGNDPEFSLGSYTPELVYSYENSCEQYGCSNTEPFYLNYRHMDYCTLVGVSEDGWFEGSIGNHPIPNYDENCEYSLGTASCSLQYTIDSFTSIREGETSPEEFPEEFWLRTIGQRPAMNHFYLALLCTIGIELSVLLIGAFILKLFKRTGWKNVLKAGIIPSLITLPYVWIILSNVGMPWSIIPFALRVFLIEGIVIVIEGYVIKHWLKIPTWQAILLSALANIISYGAGLVLMTIIS